MKSGAPPTHITRAARNSGFTLIELMVVMVLIGIMTALIVPEMKGTYEDALLRAAGRQLVDVCSLASSQAVTKNQRCRLRLDLSKGHYSLEQTVPQSARGTRFVPLQGVPGAEGNLDQRIKVQFRDPDETAVEPAAAEPDLPRAPEEQSAPDRPLLTFYPDGTADAGEILLRDREGFQLDLRINPTTGQVRIKEGTRHETP